MIKYASKSFIASWLLNPPNVGCRSALVYFVWLIPAGRRAGAILRQQPTVGCLSVWPFNNIQQAHMHTWVHPSQAINRLVVHLISIFKANAVPKIAILGRLLWVSSQILQLCIWNITTAWDNWCCTLDIPWPTRTPQQTRRWKSKWKWITYKHAL